MKYFISLLVVLMSLVSCEKRNTNNSENGFISIKSPTSIGSMQPFLFSKDKNLFMSWTQKMNDSIYTLNYSELKKGKWTETIEITRGDNWFVNWADFPAISENNGNILTYILQKSEASTYAYDIHMYLAGTDENSVNKNFILHSDSTKTEHGFVSMLPYKDDSFFVTWLDGRNTGGGSHDVGHSSNGAMSIRAASVLQTGEVVDDTLVDNKTCDCCQTSAAITPKGPIIVYRDRTDDEVRDIYISRLFDGSWTIPKPIHNDNWIINGCPVNGPKAATFNNSLVVAWFTAARNTPKVNIIFSDDSGKSFDTPIQIDNGKPIGRVDVALLDENNALVSWMESSENGAEIKVVKVNSNGAKQKPLIAASLSAARSSGFPQMEVFNDTVYFAWNDISENQPVIKMTRIDISSFN
jgi:hypothetical protein